MTDARIAAANVSRFLAIRREHLALEAGFIVDIDLGSRGHVRLNVEDVEALVAFAHERSATDAGRES